MTCVVHSIMSWIRPRILPRDYILAQNFCLAPCFETALVKANFGKNTLSRIECLGLWGVERRDCKISTEGVQEISFAHQDRNRQRHHSASNGEKQEDTRFLLSTSNICERLCSEGGFTLKDRRKLAQPEIIESHLLLHMHGDMWDANYVIKLVT